ncbi:flavonoid 3'5'-hydroxylase protein [Dioscorea alata]|uniref:Flavonoid 3'5'-hydroxylase protein n=1 Tax=Dioscorea alata TaxID=55571 RepID=A0ACB7VSC1_DIOAL|nr:flavonoid 3'5'-hydroxylase protein [Dioscorea alata]
MDATLLLIILTSLFFPLLLHLLLRRHHRSTLPHPPGPRGYPILGALPLIGPAAHVSLANLAKRYGPIMYLKLGTRSVVVASTSSAARSFLTTFDRQFANRPTATMKAKEALYNGDDMVFSNYTPRWKLLRRLSTIHMLGNKAFTKWADVRRSEVTHMLHAMHEFSKLGKPVLVPEMLICATTNIIGRVMLSQRVFESVDEELGKFKDVLKEVMTGAAMFNIGDFVPGIGWMDLQGIKAKLVKGHRKLDDMMKRMLALHKATAKERVGCPDFIDLVLASELRDDDGEKLSDVNIRALLTNMFLAGTDTSTIIVEWALAELIKNPTILKRLQSEMDAIIGQERILQEDDISNLPYLQAICKEALRLHASTPLSIPHYSFESCEVEGYHIPADTRLLINIWAIGRDPDIWENPLEFIPERFLPGGKAVNKEPHGTDFEMIPFGAGRRICVGKQAGMVFVQYLLGVLVHGFNWQMPKGEEIDLKETPGLVIPKEVPIKAFVTPRLPSKVYF